MAVADHGVAPVDHSRKATVLDEGVGCSQIAVDEDAIEGPQGGEEVVDLADQMGWQRAPLCGRCNVQRWPALVRDCERRTQGVDAPYLTAQIRGDSNTVFGGQLGVAPGAPCHPRRNQVGPRSLAPLEQTTLCQQPGRGDFPDSVTERGRKHLEELGRLAENGWRAVQLFLLGRTDCDRVAPAREIDPAYARALVEARERGVEVVAVRLSIEDREDGDVLLEVAGECPFEM